MRVFIPALVVLGFIAECSAQNAAEVRPIPPPGIAVPDADRNELAQGVEKLGREIQALRNELQDKPAQLALLPDVQIFHKAVDWALRYGEFFDPKHIATAKSQLVLGMQRASELRENKPSWNEATGLVVRGYVSKIDGSVQPYGLVIPEDWKPAEVKPRRLDFWLRGRAEKSTELAFLEDRLRNKGEFAPGGAIVLHPFGRYCNANKFAGEVDLFEALADARKHYAIDPQRLAVRGFSMGGASTWQFATHFPGMWAAAAPGAGFSETAEFFKVFAEGKEPPPWWEQVLWRWYDATLYAANLANVPTIAYSGELDGQKQAADIMLRFAENEGLSFPHIIGPQTAHKYHPESKPKIEEFVTAAVEKGRPALPAKLQFTTYTPIYSQSAWAAVESLEMPWERADLEAEIADTGGEKEVRVKTKNVHRFSLDLSPADSIESGAKLIIDGQNLGKQNAVRSLPPPGSNALASWWRVTATRKAGQWSVGNPLEAGTLKTPEICGPIDHAFMARFIFVRPTGQPLNEQVGAWAKSELAHATEFWRKVFRGDAIVKDDTAITADDIASSHLVLWGDPASNAVWKKLGDGLPLKWDAQALELGGVKYDPAHHVPALIFPNPLNPQRYLVLNSGPTFREQALLNNSDQTPKLPDWAIIDVRTPAGPRWPGLVLDAGFFDLNWQLPQQK